MYNISCNISEEEWNIVQMPFSLGGWNFIPLEVLSPCAFLASHLANREAVLEFRPDTAERYDEETRKTIELIKKNDPSAKLPELKQTTKQKELVEAVMQSRFESLYAKADNRTKALLLGGKQPHANLWKIAAHTPELYIEPKVFRIAAPYSIGSTMIETERTCPLCDKAILDLHCDHALICMNTGTVVNRHNDLYRIFAKTAREGLLSVQVEKEFYFPVDESKWKADMVIMNGVPGIYSNSPAAFDLTITCNFNKTLIKRSARTELHAALSGEIRKEKELEERVNSINYTLAPLAFETMGGHSPAVEPFAHYLMKEKSLMKNIPFTEVANSFWQQVSVTLQKANALAIFDRVNV